jgi:malate dehydrogenase
MNNAKGIPADRFFAMTSLDENRAKSQLAIKAGTDVTAVKNLIIWGNHSSTQYPDFFNATINGKAIPDVITDHEWLKGDFLKTVQQRGAAIIKARGASSAASAANAAVDGVRNLVMDTPAGDSFSMCLSSNGEYGVDKGLIFSYPCRVEGGKLKVIEGIKHNEFGQEKFKLTLEELRGERDAVKSLNLI